ncbi:MAG: hypothetical protein IKB96_05975 [Prevotella sp.]|nr:hypothetical protein [Prevotella sp.]
MTEAQRERRRQVQHERYMRKRVEIRAYQKNYYETHKEEIKAKRRQREFERRYLHPKKPPRTRKELDHDYYMRHREEIIAKAVARKKQVNYERKR